MFTKEELECLQRLVWMELEDGEIDWHGWEDEAGGLREIKGKIQRELLGLNSAEN